MSALTIFFSMGLLSYWMSRTFLIMRAPAEEIDRVLAADLLYFRQVLGTFPPILSAV